MLPVVQHAAAGWHPGTVTPEGRTYYYHFETAVVAWDEAPTHHPLPAPKVAWRWAVQKLRHVTAGATSGAEGDAHLHAALAAKDAELAKARDDHARELQRVQADFEARMRAAGYDSSAAARGGDAEARPNASVLPSLAMLHSKPRAASRAAPPLAMLQASAVAIEPPPLMALRHHDRPRKLSRPPPLDAFAPSTSRPPMVASPTTATSAAGAATDGIASARAELASLQAAIETAKAELESIQQATPQATVVDSRAVVPLSPLVVTGLRKRQIGSTIATKTHKAEREGDLGFEAGETLCVTAARGLWWSGFLVSEDGLSSGEGVFPSNHTAGLTGTPRRRPEMELKPEPAAAREPPEARETEPEAESEPEPEQETGLDSKTEH